MSTIPASELVSVTPSVISAAGTGFDIIGLILSTSTRVPIGTVASFPSEIAVSDYFGPSSKEAAVAAVYFEGFENATKTPGSVLFTQYNQAAVSAYVRGGNISAVTQAELNTYSGTLSVTIDGNIKSASISLSGASTFSNAAEIIANDLGIEGVAAGVFTGSIGGTFTCTASGTTLSLGTVLTGSLQVGDSVSGTDGTNSLPGGCYIVRQIGGAAGGIGTYQLSAPTLSGTLNTCTVTSSSTTLNITGVTSGALGVADVISGGSIISGTYITSLISATGGVGLYGISGTGQTVASGTVDANTPAVQYDSIAEAFVILSGTTGPTSTITFGSGALASLLLLTQTTGAVLSQGAAASTPAAFMNALVSVTTNWAVFTTLFDPDGGSLPPTQKEAFAAWKNTQNNRYGYVVWDTDTGPTVSAPDMSSLGYILDNNGDSGSCVIYHTASHYIAGFICGAAASINFQQTNGRITFAYKQQPGLTADVTTATAAQNLLANGYNFYGAYGAANQNYVWFQNGSCTGPFLWFDSYINQIWLNNQLQLALLNLLENINSIPYNSAGNSLIQQAIAPVIAAGLNFGAFAPGSISTAEQAEVNQQAGANIANTLQTQGWYFQILAASSAVRAARGSPPCNLWYLDRGSVQQISLSSVAVE